MRMCDVLETQGFRKVGRATTVPMHFQLLESDVLLELLEALLVELSLLLVELSRAGLTLSSNSGLRQLARAFPHCRLRSFSVQKMWRPTSY